MTTTTPLAVDPEKDLALSGSALINAIVELHGERYVYPSGHVSIVGDMTDDPLRLVAIAAADYLPSVRRMRAFVEAIGKGESVAEACRQAGIKHDEDALFDLGDDAIWDTFRLVEYALRPGTPHTADRVEMMGRLVDAVVASNDR